MNTRKKAKNVRFIDLFCGIGGFHIATSQAAEIAGTKSECVFSCDIDVHCQAAYKKNFKQLPVGDISDVNPKRIPDHDLLLAGFPCQPFSIIGQRKGFEDTRGTLFFDIANILLEKQPSAFILENVKMLKGHNGGKTITRILQSLNDLGYFVTYQILNALDYGLPQKRERIFIVGQKDPNPFSWPTGKKQMMPLSSILEVDVPEQYFASKHIRQKRLTMHKPTKEPSIWHENKSGNVSVYPYSCALRAGASYNYLLVNGERRLTPREMLRLQGFPDAYSIVCNASQTRKQAGNSLPVPVAQAVLERLFIAQGWNTLSPLVSEPEFVGPRDDQLRFLEKKEKYGKETVSAT
jgi:DNA (cytosine-5)-methyltransferase 1